MITRTKPITNNYQPSIIHWQSFAVDEEATWGGGAHLKKTEGRGGLVPTSGRLSQAEQRQEEMPSGRAGSLWYPVTARSSLPATV